MTISVTAINIFPVKALGGIPLQNSLLTNRGLQFDRRFLVVDQNDMFLTQRDYPKMATVWVECEGGVVTFSAPDVDGVAFAATPQPTTTRTVTVWSSQVAAQAVGTEADQWLSDFLGAVVRLVYMPEASARLIDREYASAGDLVSFADGYPVLMASTASLDDLNARIVAEGGVALPMNRFRPNLVVSGGAAFAEAHLGIVAIGECVFRAVKPCVRCQVTTTDQASGVVMGPEPLQTLGRYRDAGKGPVFGMNLIPVKLGTVRVGDSVTF